MACRGRSSCDSIGDGEGTEDLDEAEIWGEEMGNEDDCNDCLGTISLGEGDRIGAGAG